MLKWKRNKYGGSHPEGLDRIDAASAVPVPMRHTQSCKITGKSVQSTPSSPRNRKNNIINRSTSEIYDRRNSMENVEHTPINRREVKSLVLENLSSPAVNTSPLVSVQWEELYKRFENASYLNVSQQSIDEDVINTTPKTSRQSSSNSMRRNSPTNLPCIEEAAENDELVSIADSGICDDDYDHKKHYFEPCKFHDDITGETNNNNETSSLKNFKKYNPCNRSLSLPSMKSNFYINNNNNNINTNKNNTEKIDSSSSDDSDSSSQVSFECSTPSDKPTDIDDKNEELYTRLRADLENTGLGQKKNNNSDEENDVSHSLM